MEKEVGNPTKSQKLMAKDPISGWQGLAHEQRMMGAGKWSGFESAANSDPVGVALVLEAGTRAGLDQTELAWVIERESGWDPKAWNHITDARGLIQWMPKTREGLGMGKTPDTRAQQAPWVYQYFNRIGRSIPKGDVLLAVFYPAAIGKPDSHVIAKRGSIVWTQNRAYRGRDNGAITAGSVRRAGNPALRRNRRRRRRKTGDRRKSGDSLWFWGVLALLWWQSSKRV